MKQLGIRTGSSKLRVLSALLGGLVLLVGIGCSDDPSPTAPPVGSDLFVTSANILVNGESVSGQALSKGEMVGDSTRFETQVLTTAITEQTPFLKMWVEFDRPQGMGMGRHSGKFALYDDGTHGDHAAGDGLYVFEDLDGDYGMHSMDAPVGTYRYEFYGIHQVHHDTNRVSVTVDIVGP